MIDYVLSSIRRLRVSRAAQRVWNWNYSIEARSKAAEYVARVVNDSDEFVRIARGAPTSGLMADSKTIHGPREIFQEALARQAAHPAVSMFLVEIAFTDTYHFFNTGQWARQTLIEARPAAAITELLELLARGQSFPGETLELIKFIRLAGGPDCIEQLLTLHTAAVEGADPHRDTTPLDVGHLSTAEEFLWRVELALALRRVAPFDVIYAQRANSRASGLINELKEIIRARRSP